MPEYFYAEQETKYEKHNKTNKCMQVQDYRAYSSGYEIINGKAGNKGRALLELIDGEARFGSNVGKNGRDIFQ